jgi:acetyl-CoA/propionyl-CoA carboxylase biotin carboxyl carrier protein
VTVSELFDTVLIANRGEIACRVIRTLRRLGIRSVAVYSDADRDARHVLEADVAVRIGRAEAAGSYLSVDAIVDAALQTEAQAIHPGYGFLSENPALAEACSAAGIVFIGPGSHALTVMADKITAKTFVQAQGVPVIPGVTDCGQDDASLTEAAASIGYPVLVKPSAGGGGKGMLAVHEASELPAALAAARRISLASFGDDTLFLERLFDTPRHIEVQVLADRHGGIVHLAERECSLQRRHQKIIEEAPSALLSPETRERIGEAACRIAAAVRYEGAGTVEFLVADAAPDDFYFMEMNTRLQVEHPVTEAVTGVDLVEWQIRIAAGQPLGFAQHDVTVRGHAIEARVYAEDPATGFLPSTGRVLALSEPCGDGIRIDSSLLPGLEVTAYYDPLLAKVVAWASDRTSAIDRLDAALGDTCILGLHTNVAYLRRLLGETAVRTGVIDTGLIERRMTELVPPPAEPRSFLAAALIRHARAWAAAGDDLWRRPTGWRPTGAQGALYPLRVADDARSVRVIGSPSNARVMTDDIDETAAVVLRADDAAQVTIGGRARRYTFAETDGVLWLGADGAAWPFRCTEQRDGRSGGGAQGVAASPEVRTPMPGTVVDVAVPDGAHVTAGQSLVTIEAMKMEHRLSASVDGVVRLEVGPGDRVGADQIVAVIAPYEGTGLNEDTDVGEEERHDRTRRPGRR